MQQKSTPQSPESNGRQINSHRDNFHHNKSDSVSQNAVIKVSERGFTSQSLDIPKAITTRPRSTPTENETTPVNENAMVAEIDKFSSSSAKDAQSSKKFLESEPKAQSTAVEVKDKSKETKKLFVIEKSKKSSLVIINKPVSESSAPVDHEEFWKSFSNELFVHPEPKEKRMSNNTWRKISKKLSQREELNFKLNRQDRSSQLVRMINDDEFEILPVRSMKNHRNFKDLDFLIILENPKKSNKSTMKLPAVAAHNQVLQKQSVYFQMMLDPRSGFIESFDVANSKFKKVAMFALDVHACHLRDFLSGLYPGNNLNLNSKNMCEYYDKLKIYGIFKFFVKENSIVSNDHLLSQQQHFF